MQRFLKKLKEAFKVLMKNLIRKITGIRKETRPENAGLFSGLLYMPLRYKTMINKYLHNWCSVAGICIVNKSNFVLIFI
ncbi:MAG TPA: hypothetical protein DEO60_00900 [Bacteroidales bacterium]|nr:hypothetical protein [Bacteroidales bacterium]